MGDPPPPPNTWPPAPNQPFYIQTMTGPAIYKPYTGLFCPVFAPNVAPADQFPAPPQPIAGTPAANASAAVASPSSPPPPPSTSAVSQSTYTPSHDMVEALEALSAEKWRMRTSLRPQQVRVCGTLHEDKLCRGVVLNVDLSHQLPRSRHTADVSF